MTMKAYYFNSFIDNIPAFAFVFIPFLIVLLRKFNGKFVSSKIFSLLLSVDIFIFAFLPLRAPDLVTRFSVEPGRYSSS